MNRFYLTMLALVLTPNLTLADTLGSLASARNFKIGTFTWNTAGSASFQSAYGQFNMITLPVYFRLVEAQKDQFDFSIPDKIADAAPKDAAFFIPALIWNELNPDWLTGGNYSGAELKGILASYITTVMQHFEAKYPRRVVGWEVASEVLSWQGPGGFWHKIGLEAGLDQYEYIRVALRAARSAVPTAKLQIEDFAVEDTGTKSDQFYALVKSLKDQEIPLDQVGFEGHFMLQPQDGSKAAFSDIPSVTVLKQNIDRYADLGLEIMFTQVDVAIRDAEVSMATLDKQAESYRRLFNACLSMKACTTITTWGVGDSDSWIPRDGGESYVGWGTPLLFDKSYRLKPAFGAVSSELSKR